MALLNELIRAAKAVEREAKRQQQQRIRAEKEHQREIERQRKAQEKAAREAEREHKQQVAAEKAAHVQRCKDEALRRTEDCQAQIEMVGNVLAASLEMSHVPDLSAVRLAFPKAEPTPPRFRVDPPKPEPLQLPAKPQEKPFPPEPSLDDPVYKKQLGLIKTKRKRAAVKSGFDGDYAAWQRSVADLRSQHSDAVSEWERETTRLKQEEARQRAEWETAAAEVSRRNAELAERHDQAKRKWRSEKASFEEGIERLSEGYTRGAPDAVSMYIEIALNQSPYPEFFPEDIVAHFNPESRQLIIDRVLPAPEALPKVKEVGYVQARDEFVEKPIAKTQATQRFDDLVYQSALRSVFEAFSADTHNHVGGVVFNGWVETADPATGKPIRPCIASFHASREEFEELDLEQVDPKACFRKLKGVAASKLHQLAPVPPLVRFNKDDDRFVDGRDVSGDLDQSTNLAAMDWEDFEHLIRELFESEFGSGGSEVKITRASRDRGVDAIAFDPDPIRGGKFVIQAKRYTRTVGVDAVRDLYGTVINEGANKGILVTTAEYGPDAYDFAKGKPLTLVSGGELLFLLDKHGHKARIDLAEAREINLAQRS